MQLQIILFVAQTLTHNHSLKIGGKGDKSLSLNGMKRYSENEYPLSRNVIHKMYVHKKFFTSEVFRPPTEQPLPHR